jgi:hypothetical protein
MRKIMLALAFAGVSAAAVAAQDNAAGDPPPDVQKLLQNCDAHKFETTVITTEDGEIHNSKVKLCGAQGQSDEAWLKTLKDAVDKTAANSDLAPDVKQQIVTALNGEIARLTALLPSKTAPVSALSIPAPVRAAPADNVASGYSVLPPLPDRPQSVPTVVAAPVVAAPGRPVAVAPPPKPVGITIRCTTARDFPAADTCDVIEPDTQLLVRADEAIVAPVTLRFVRRGDPRGEVRLAPMARGDSARLTIPAEVCAGIFRSKLDIQVVGAAAQTFGPFDLRC